MIWMASAQRSGWIWFYLYMNIYIIWKPRCGSRIESWERSVRASNAISVREEKIYLSPVSSSPEPRTRTADSRDNNNQNGLIDSVIRSHSKLTFNHTMFAARLSAASARRSAAFNWARSFSNTSPLADQYDVVVVGTSDTWFMPAG